MIFDSPLTPWSLDDSRRLDKLARLTKRPRMLRAVLDEKGRTLATVPVDAPRPAGPWDGNEPQER